MSVAFWGWIFLAAYVAVMFYFGYVGLRRTTNADSYATARGSYSGPLLGLSFMAMIASGSTFMGMPGIAYESGFKAAYYPLLYPVGAYIGVMIVARRMKGSGDRMGSISVPDFLGDLFRSPILRALAALLSLFLIYYLMAQLAASGQMFETLFGISYQWGITIAMLIILGYMFFGGTHSDIVTDAVQGIFMLVIAVMVIGGFLIGFGVDGFGPGAVNAALAENMRWDVHTDPTGDSTFANWWVIVLLLVAHLGFVVQPHLGNKFFALRGTAQVRWFVVTSSLAGFTVSFLFLGGVLARAIGVNPGHSDAVMPALFIEMAPAWLAALLSVAILSAIVSSSDGLLMSISQIFANDLYRKTWVPWRGQDPDSPAVDRRSLLIGRAGVLVAGAIAVAAVWTPPELLAVWMWVGVGGMISSLTGPLFLGVWWRGATAPGALTGMLSGFGIYAALHLGPQFGLYAGAFPWNDNPFAATAVGMVTGLLGTCVGSVLTNNRTRTTNDVETPEHSRET
ncbi:sodium:solute symporter family protein [Actinopolyspora saharensis]|uniref:Sodium/proline symporter n=1 Tax=Actinopolyspora saharensis TaxID=995062 RepID=A0A1H1GYV8_9ACTN|nr:sodium:solute symporter family protein [Actinopolyspora saharensis]SDR18319.1 sodium/proline symporter [Actinopolyspora saharensis]